MNVLTVIRIIIGTMLIATGVLVFIACTAYKIFRAIKNSQK